MRVRIGVEDDFPEGRLRGMVVEGRPLVVGRCKGELSVMDGRCSHAGYDLSNGKFRDGVVTCPLHGAEFEIRTGRRVAFAGAKDLRVYLVSVENGEVFLTL